ncbi:hypothetical protein SAMN05216312_109208 [Cohnella sp. OV330]|uniref:glycosyltransferase n=1 Tax=Cohnella sp. OV330 TaxID=1855288 RepID=UPI0008F16604|nr:glycosyltransferase [Cohnella sp. OV330]SFB47878.1 hypothetical protein SAMN05216312_109208 [Cohnella sp. OV330]
MSRYQTVIQFYNDIEKNFNVENWQLNGVDVWPLIRIFSGFPLTIQVPEASHVQAFSDSNDFPVLSDLLSNRDSHIDAFFLFDSIGRSRLNNVWYHRLIEPWIESLEKIGIRAVSLEYNQFNVHQQPVKSETYSLTRFFKSVSEQPIDEVDVSFDTRLLESIGREYEKKFPESSFFPDLPKLMKWVSEIKRNSEMMKALLSKYKAKIVFMVNSANLSSMAWALAARELNIPSVEIQHGVLGEIIYKQWSNVPQKGFNTMPFYYWCWSEEEAESVNLWAVETGIAKGIAGGNLWNELWKNDESEIVKSYDKQLTHMNDSRYHILLTLQPLYGLDDWTDNLPDWVLSAIAKSPDAWLWHVRYHPQMLGRFHQEATEMNKKLEPLIKANKIEVEKATAEPLMALLKKTDIHITAFSSSVVEAAEFGVPSIVLHPNANRFFAEQFKTGLVFKAETTNELLDAVLRIKKQKNLAKTIPRINERQDSQTILNKLIYPEEATVLKNHLCHERQYHDIKGSLAKVLYIDGYYELLTEKYKHSNDVNEVFWSGIAYNALGNDRLSFKLLDQLTTLGAVDSNLSIMEFNQVVKLYVYFNHHNYISQRDRVGVCIMRYLERNRGAIGWYIKILFDHEQYKPIIRWFSDDPHPDCCYYVGRAFIREERYMEARGPLLSYLREVENSNDPWLLGRKDVYKASALFYLGELYLRTEEKRRAAECFAECKRISQKPHRKAEEYLMMLEEEKRD